MLATVHSSTLLGIDAHPVEVEVDITSGVTKFDLVGLPDAAVLESKERVRSAIQNAGFAFPLKKIVVNLAPGDIRKAGAMYDLPIALGILGATGQIDVEELGNLHVVGELALDGTLRSVPGILPTAIRAEIDKRSGFIVPHPNRNEASLVSKLDIYPAKHLRDIIDHLSGYSMIKPFKNGHHKEKTEHHYTIDFIEVRGQEAAKRACEIAAAGHHNLLMIGPPGSGKSMIAKRIGTILPELTFEEALEITKIHSIMGMVGEGRGLVRERPFRSPHHTISAAGLVGGGTTPTPGEVSLAHLGVLFLDELPEFRRDVLEVMRQPLEDRKVTISRASGTLTFPSNFMLVCAMNPCPCGYYGDSVKECTCSQPKINHYRQRVSGPLLDRIDLHVNVPRVPYDKLRVPTEGEPSSTIQARVDDAHNIQAARFSGLGIFANAQMGEKEIREHCRIPDDAHALLKRAVDSLGLSARAYNRIFKISRTIADLDGSNEIRTAHVAEAIQYRMLDRSNQ
ncbi:MAG TPA: YifB family Mg chelatase-like AAA ATPase [bacterium]|jgi:magnesium chelatase family protein